MAETAELLQGLTDLRLPEPGLAEVLAALAAGLLIAAVLGGLAIAFRRRPARVTMVRRIEAARSLAPPDRTVALAALLRELTDRRAPGSRPWAERAAAAFGLDPLLRSTLADGLYRPGTAPDLEALEDAVRRAARRAGV